MISIGIDLLFTTVVSVILLALGVAHLARMRAENTNSWSLSEELLCRCRHCGSVFLGPRTVRDASCPHCQEPVRVRDRKASKRVRY